MWAIEEWDSEEGDASQLLQLTLGSIMQKRIAVSRIGLEEECTANSFLPAELRLLLKLSPDLRYCFVLRILVGLSMQVCSRILHLCTGQIEECCCGAMRTLPNLTLREAKDYETCRTMRDRRRGKE